MTKKIPSRGTLAGANKYKAFETVQGLAEGGHVNMRIDEIRDALRIALGTSLLSDNMVRRILDDMGVTWNKPKSAKTANAELLARINQIEARLIALEAKVGDAQIERRF